MVVLQLTALLLVTALRFDSTLSSHMALQQAPARAAVYGTIDSWRIALDMELPEVVVSVASHDSQGTHRLYTTHAMVNMTGGVLRWVAYLRPTAGGSAEFAIHAGERGDGGGTTLWHVVFGDVWLCTGQSNMAVALRQSLNREDVLAKMKSSHALGGVRFLSGEQVPGPSFISASILSRVSNSSWRSARAGTAGATGPSSDAAGPFDGPLFSLCGVCWFFAQALIGEFEAAGRTPPQLGLVCAAAGGTPIEQWLPPPTSCRYTARVTGEDFERRLTPFTRMTLKGWIWYQGEFNLGSQHISGSSAGGYGYGCMLPELVRKWRAMWSEVPGTTAVDAPFGVATVAANGGWMGARDFGGFRHAQTANYGTLPNPQMPNTFLAQGYDVTDPWGQRSPPDAPDQPPGSMVWIHPRNKQVYGTRLARAAFGQVYGGQRATSGPTISSCRVEQGGSQGGRRLVLRFNATALRGEQLVLQSYQPGRSLLQVLRVRKALCMQPVQHCPNATASNAATCHAHHRQYFCPAAFGPGFEPRKVDLAEWTPVRGYMLGYLPPSGEWDTQWQPLNITPGAPFEIVADLDGGAIHAVRYAWGVKTDTEPEQSTQCCENSDPQLLVEGAQARKNKVLLSWSKPCRAGLCPIVASGGLPANPFIARIVDGRCQCIPPQVCD